MTPKVRWIGLSLLAFAAVAQAQTSHQVKTVTIRSGWGGLGSAQDLTVTIRRSQTGFVRDKKEVAPELVQALVSALEEPRVEKPNAINLGITEEWLKAQVGSQKPESFSQATKNTPGQLAFFKEKFTDLKVVTEVVPNLWMYSKFDDYPRARVEIEFEDGSKLKASTSSYYVFMIPWQVDGQNGTTYNADISKAVAALLPEKAVNKGRLTGPDLAEQLTKALINSIETEWNLRGTEEMAGDSLKQLRQKYEVVSAEITPYHHPEYGTATYKKEPEERNLHVSLRKTEFPPNVADATVLKVNHGNVEGVDQFLANAWKYEKLALSVPWLNQFVHDHPKVFFRISYVHDASFGDKALRTFVGDMKLRQRQDLINQVTTQQKDIALLIVGMTYSESYWLVFPDKHMLLWRYGGPSGLLNWKPSDFGEGECADYRVNNGGCSGGEVAASGSLLPAHEPRDRECMTQQAKEQVVPGLSGDDLFAVMDHGRGGFIDRVGKIVIPLCFEEVGAFSEGLARFERDGSWGYIDTTGNVVIEPKFPWAEEFHEGLAHAQVSGSQLGYDGRWGFIDKTGAIVVAGNYAEMLGGKSNIGGDDDEGAFHEGLALVLKHYKYGFIDKNGKEVIPLKFDYAGPFSEGLAPAAMKSGDVTHWGYIDHTGKWVIAPNFEAAYPFSNKLAGVEQGQNCGYISPSGEFAVQLTEKTSAAFCSGAVSEFSEGLAVWKEGKLFGYIDTAGKTVIPAKFDLAMPFSEGLAGVRVDGKWGFIDKTGRMVIQPMELLGVEEFHHGLSFVRTKDMRYGYVDFTGRYAWKPTFLYVQ
jgi:hypothetical protein